ncbi:MAG TPA: DUF4259 domain-containing protein [Isosphaeraceae bacterium]
MGAWGVKAWENDGAADWFGDTFDTTGLADRVEETLGGDPEDDHQEIRAAAYLLVALGRVYIWPVERLDRHLALAIAKLEAIRDMDIYQEASGFVEAIDEEIATLQSRLKPKPKAN